MKLNSLEQVLRPNDAVDRFGWCIPNCAPREGFLRCLWCTFVALCFTFHDQFDLTVVASGAAFNQRHICG